MGKVPPIPIATPRPSSDRCPPPVVAPAPTRRPGEAEASKVAKVSNDTGKMNETNGDHVSL